MTTATDLDSLPNDLNSLTTRTDIPGEVFPEGDLPSFGGGRQTLPPGTDTFRIPFDLPQLWHDLKDPSGVPTGHIMLKFDKDHPLVVVGGPNEGAPMTASFTSVARPRGKRGDASAPIVSDLSYFLDRGLGDKTRPLSLGGIAGMTAMKAAINKHAGGTVSLTHGLTGQCRPDKVRYVFVDLSSNKSMQDPEGIHGCGQRHYTRDFTKPSYEEVIPCKGKLEDGSPCPAAIRGFESVDW